MQLLYIDLFCGAGGTSTGVERARIDGSKCAKVIACVNHDANATSRMRPTTRTRATSPKTFAHSTSDR